MAVAMETDNFPYLPSGLAEVNKMIKEHGDLFSDSQCKVCSAVLISESQKLTHYQSKKHANKVRRYISLQNEKETAPKKLKADMDCDNGDPDRAKACPLCKMTFSSPVLAELHYQGKVHAKKLRLQNPAAAQTPPTAPPKKKPADDVSSAPATGDNNNNPDRFCSICQASFNNPLMAQQHYVGKKHRKQMARQKLIETYGPSTAPASTPKGYPCTICNIKLNSVEQYQSHISGAKHKNQVKKAGLNAAKPESEDAAEPPKEGGDDKYTDNQYATWDEQSGATDDQYAANDDQYAAGHEQFAAGDEQFAAGDEQFAAGDEQFAAGDDQYPAAEDQYAAGDEQYTAGDNQYAPENAEYTEEYQFT